MKKAAFLTLCLAGAVVALGAVAGGAQESLTDDLDRHIGRDLVGSGRAEKADVGWLLPQSCPPFYLRDSGGAIIDPNDPAAAGKPLPPVSAVQTCMKCKETHDPNRVLGGYHFQAGRGQLFPSSQWDEQAPVDKGSGFYGKWLSLYQRELAPKNFDDPAEIDMTAYDWVSACGVCHPGGGPAELDRGGRRYDWVLSQEPVMADYTYDGDYYHSRWDESGVAEADCFICHLENYEYSLRAQQLKKLNYKWATTEAAGFGQVEGAVIDDEVPKIAYNTNLFRADGKVHLHIQRPTDKACMFCHTMSAVKKRGTAWHNPFIEDVHTDLGVACTDCHPGDIRHNFAKGDSVNLATRDDLDNTMQSCEECHYETKAFGAPAHDHQGIPPLHFERMSCESCHITTRPFLSTRIVDTLTGRAIELPNSPAVDVPQAIAFGAAWGRVVRAEETSMVPFSPERLEAAAGFQVAPDSPIRNAFVTGGLPEGSFTVREFMANGDGPALADTPDKRKLMLLAFEQIVTPDDDTIVACLFRGETYRVLKGKLVPIDTTLQPRRVGRIAQYPVTQMYRESADGTKVLTPVGYQLGVFWAFEQEGTIRPLFLREMKAAWDFLNGTQEPPASGEAGEETYQYRYFPKDPPGVEVLPIPNASEVPRKEYIGGLMARIRQYGPDDWTSLEIWDDNNDRLPEANTEREMGIMAWAIARTMERLEVPTVYYIKGMNVYRVQVEDPVNPYTLETNAIGPIVEGEPFFAIFKYQWSETRSQWRTRDVRPMVDFKYTVEQVDVAANPQLAALAQRQPWSIAHGVEPAGRALGANGCDDCHSADAPFFFGTVLVDPFDEQGNPVTISQAELLGYDGQPRKYTGAAGATNTFFKWFTIAVLAALIGHMLLDFLARVRSKKKSSDGRNEMVQRFNGHFLSQHFLLVVSVVVLMLSAIPLWGLRYPGAEWAAVLTTSLGGVDLWRMVHRAGACGLIFVCIYHIVYCLAHAEGRRDFALMLPRPKDFGDLGLNLLWFFGIRKTPPNFGRFTYSEKFDYWAVFWGCVIMVGTGLAMWFPNLVRVFVPGASLELFDTLKEAHAHEAILAFLAIVIWHFYNVHYRPGRFPGSLCWLHGRITRHEQQEEHPAEDTED